MAVIRRLNQFLAKNGCDNPGQYKLKVRVTLFCKLKNMPIPSKSKISDFLYEHYLGTDTELSKKVPAKRRTRKVWKKIISDRREQYNNYITSSQWKTLRSSIIEKRGHKCEKCGASKGTIHAHHLTYERFMNELESDIMLLCVPCHEGAHNRIFKNNRTH